MTPAQPMLNTSILFFRVALSFCFFVVPESRPAKVAHDKQTIIPRRPLLLFLPDDKPADNK